MVQKPKVLVVAEKWAECNPDIGLSSSHHNFVGSLRETGLAEVSCFFFDEIAFSSGERPDTALLDACRTEKPDLLFLKMVRGTDLNPELQTLAKIRDRLGVKIISLHGDTHDDYAVRWMESISPVVDLIVVIDCYSVYKEKVSDTSKYLDTWTPQDPTIFYGSIKERPIDVSFIGAVNRYTDRKLALGILAHSGVDVVQKGGVGENKFSIADYAEYLRKSKITLNFSRPVFDEPNFQCKGRTVEATLCGALLMESTNPETRTWFTPNEDYVEFENERDLVEKVRYYLDHEDERRQIANRGHQKAIQKYSAEKYWELIFERLNSG